MPILARLVLMGNISPTVLAAPVTLTARRVPPPPPVSLATTPFMSIVPMCAPPAAPIVLIVPVTPIPAFPVEMDFRSSILFV